MKSPLPPPSLDDTPSEPLTSKQVHEYRAMVKDRLNGVMESIIFMCGMVALDLDNMWNALFHCEPSLECDTHGKSEFYVSRIQLERVVLCCHYTGTMPAFLIELNTHLNAPKGSYFVVL